MVELNRESNVEEICNFLNEKKSQNQKVVLYLGQKTGLCYITLYTALIKCAQSTTSLIPLLKPEYQAGNHPDTLWQHIHSLHNLQKIEQIRASHQALTLYFSKHGIDIVLHKALAGYLYREEDEMMAKLIIAGFFGSIITTPIDDLLVQALNGLGIKSSEDYQLFICEIDNSVGTGSGSNICGPIVKISGNDLFSHYHWKNTASDQEADAQLKQFLLRESAKDIIILGFDPLLDQALEFQETGGAVWYINEERPEVNTPLAQILNQRQSKYLIGQSYSQFLQSIQPLMAETGQQTARGNSVQPEQRAARNKVFISYCRADHAYLERLQVHLNGHFYNEEDTDTSQEEVLDIRNEVWDDTRIQSGADWKKEINDALIRAKVAVLLVSADFLASEFIRRYELPVLLSAEKNHELKILMVIIGPCAFHTAPLKRYQAIHPVNEPLMGLTHYERELIWQRLANEVMNLLRP